MGLSSLKRIAFLVLVLLLAWSVPAFAQEPDPSGNVGSMGDEDGEIVELAPIRPADYYYKLLTTARRDRGATRYKKAFDTLSEILSEGSEIEPYYEEAQYEIALTLFDMGLFQSALGFIERIVDKGVTHQRHRDSLQWLVRLQRKLPGNMTVLEKISTYPVAVYPPAMTDEIHYLVGRYHYSEGALQRALARLRQVRRVGKSNFIKASYLSGVIYVEIKKARQAEKAFKDILRYFATSGSPSPEMDRFNDLSTLALARMFFTVGNHRAAERFYKRIPKGSEYWLNAVYEISWTYFHLGDYARSMGNLWTLDTPYFEEEYFPEARLLQATILYSTCNNRDVIQFVNRFVPEFQTLQKEVRGILARTDDPNEFYFYLARLSTSQSKSLSLEVRRLFNAALSSRRVQRYFDFILQINGEIKRAEGMERMAKGSTRLVLRRMIQDLGAHRELIVGETGDLVKTRLARVRKDVSALLTDSLRLKFETIRRLRKKIGKKSKGPTRVVTQEIKADDEHVLYDFDGEYWLDELGNYLYEVQDRCPKK
jgi:tetratricopeptide (TPR) repeat protein